MIADRRTIDDAIEARRALRRLAELPERQRQDVTLRVAGFSYTEIREITGGRTYTNVISGAARRGRRKLRLLIVDDMSPTRKRESIGGHCVRDQARPVS